MFRPFFGTFSFNHLAPWQVSPMCDRAVGEDSIPKQQLGPEHHRKKLWPARVMRHPLFQQEFLLRMVNCELQDTSKAHCWILISCVLGFVSCLNCTVLTVIVSFFWPDVFHTIIPHLILYPCLNVCFVFTMFFHHTFLLLASKASSISSLLLTIRRWQNCYQRRCCWKRFVSRRNRRNESKCVWILCQSQQSEFFMIYIEWAFPLIVIVYYMIVMYTGHHIHPSV